ncbi:MAG: hypothetical protein WCI04_05645 [archaeon]
MMDIASIISVLNSPLAGNKINKNCFAHKLTSQKGFIGPIGDDLPSLVPIVVALLLFFSIFALTLNSYNSKNADLKKQIEMTSVARELKGDSLILDVESFSKKCETLKLKKYPYNFMAAIYSTTVNMGDVVGDFSKVSQNITDLEYPSSDETNFLKQKFVEQNTVSVAVVDSGGYLRTTVFNNKNTAFFCNYKMVGGTEFSSQKKNYLLRFYPVAVQLPLEVSVGEVQYLTVPALMGMVFWN